MHQDIVEANRQRDLWLTDRRNVFFVPRGWCDEWSVAAGCSGGLDNVDDDGRAAPEIYCYAPTHRQANSPVDTLFASVGELQKLDEITEAAARSLHPALADCLDAINAE